MSRLSEALKGGASEGTIVSADVARNNPDRGGGGQENDDHEDVISESELKEIEDSEEFSEEDRAALRSKPIPEEEESNEEEEPPPRVSRSQEDEGTEEEPPEVSVDGKRPPPGFVSIKALQETRGELKSVKDELKQFKDAIAQRVQENRARRAAADRQQQVEDEDADIKGIDIDKDPMGAIDALKQALLNERAARRQDAEKRQQQEEEARRGADEQRGAVEKTQKVIDTADSILTQAAEADPTVREAFEYASQAIVQELTEQGLKGAQLQKAFNNALFQYAYNAPNDPKRMVQYAHRNARYWGWEPGKKYGQKPGTRSVPNAGKRGNGADESTERLERIRRGTERSRTLSGGGHQGGGELTVDDLADMSGEELEALADEHPELFEKAAKRGG